MAVYLIGYDLREGEDYESLIETIKSLGNWWHYLDSTWLVDSVWNQDQITNALISKLQSNSDRFLVMPVSRPVQGWLSGDAWNWINQRV